MNQQNRDWAEVISPNANYNVTANEAIAHIEGLKRMNFPEPLEVYVKGKWSAQPMAAPVIPLSVALANGLPPDLPVYILYNFANAGIGRVVAHHVDWFNDGFRYGLQRFYDEMKGDFGVEDVKIEQYLATRNSKWFFESFEEDYKG